MTIQEDIILLLSILIGFLVFGFYILKKSLYNHNLKLQKELNNFKIETKKEFERVRFTEKPICKVGDIYSKQFLVTKSKYNETVNIQHPNLINFSLLSIGHNYEIFNMKDSTFLDFNSSYGLKKFLKDNNLTLDETKE
jgi:hypothetical protein